MPNKERLLLSVAPIIVSDSFLYFTVRVHNAICPHKIKYAKITFSVISISKLHYHSNKHPVIELNLT